MEGLISLLAEWHSGTAYLGEHMQEPSGKGVRQGCAGAPTLWAVLTCHFLTKLSQSVPTHWIKHCVNIFADDLQGGDAFWDERELGLCLRYLGSVADCLEPLGLTVNPSKMVAMLQLAGNQRRKWQSTLVQCGANGACLVLPRQNGALRAKLVSTVTYLGVRISYSAFETVTQCMRTCAANSLATQLSRWLYSKRKLPLHTRIGLWKTCIVPCAEYGLLAVGLNHRMLTKHAACHLFDEAKVHYHGKLVTSHS